MVEDDNLVREVLVDILTDAGLSVDQAGGSTDAVRLIDADGYAVLVTDFNMLGRMNGPQLASYAQERDSAMEVLVVSGRPDNLARARAANAGWSTLSKPFADNELVAEVRRLLRSRVRS